MKQQSILCTFIILATSLYFVQSQQYVPVNVLIPTLNGSYIIPSNISAYNNGYRPSYNNSNNGYNYNNGNNGYRPPGSYSGNQYPNYYYNNTRNNSGYNETKEGHLFVGTIQLYDRLLFNQNYRKEGRWWSNREKIIEYPQAAPAGYTRHEIISAIRIYNQFLDGNSARASILKGGVGYQYCKIKLESKSWNKGFQYLVQIFGH